MQRGLVWAVDNGFRKVYNSLPSTNEAARRFLEAYGWEVEAVRRDHYLIDGEYVDEVSMAVYPDDPDGTTGANPGGAAGDVPLPNAKRHLERALGSADPATIRFHVRNALQFVEAVVRDAY